MGVLTGDRHGEGIVLSDEEFRILQNALALWRSEDNQANAIAKASHRRVAILVAMLDMELLPMSHQNPPSKDMV